MHLFQVYSLFYYICVLDSLAGICLFHNDTLGLRSAALVLFITLFLMPCTPDLFCRWNKLRQGFHLSPVFLPGLRALAVWVTGAAMMSLLHMWHGALKELTVCRTFKSHALVTKLTFCPYTIGPTLKISTKTLSESSLIPGISPFYPILWNPHFPPGLLDGPFQILLHSHCFQAFHFLESSRWPSIVFLTQVSGTFHLDFWRVLQIIHFLQSLPLPLVFPRALSPLEKLCSDKGWINHFLSLTYSLLNTPSDIYKPN